MTEEHFETTFKGKTYEADYAVLGGSLSLYSIFGSVTAEMPSGLDPQKFASILFGSQLRTAYLKNPGNFD